MRHWSHLLQPLGGRPLTTGRPSSTGADATADTADRGDIFSIKLPSMPMLSLCSLHFRRESRVRAWYINQQQVCAARIQIQCSLKSLWLNILKTLKNNFVKQYKSVLPCVICRSSCRNIFFNEFSAKKKTTTCLWNIE